MQRQLEMELNGGNCNNEEGLPLFDRRCNPLRIPTLNLDYILPVAPRQSNSQLYLPFRGTHHSKGEEPTLWYH